MRSKTRRKSGKRLFIILAVFLICLAGAMFILPMVFKQKIELAIEQKINEMTGGNYKANMTDLKINLFTNSVVASNFEMKMDTAAFRKNGGALGLDLQVEEIKFRGVNFWKLLFSNTFQLNNVKISKGRVYCTWNPDRKQQQRNIIEKKGGVEHVLIKNISLDDMQLDFYNENKKAIIYTGVADINLTGLQINKVGFPTVRTLDAEFSKSEFYTGSEYFPMGTTRFSYHNASVGIKIIDFKFTDKSQHQLKIFPGSSVKYNFQAEELSLFFKDLTQVQALANNETPLLSVTKINVIRPILTFYKDTLKTNDSIEVSKKTFPFFVNQLNLVNGKFVMVDKASNKLRIICNGINLDLFQLKPSPADYVIPYRAAGFNLDIDSIKYYHKNEIQQTKLVKLNLSTDDSVLTCEKLFFKTTVPQNDFFTIKEYQCDLPYVEMTDFSLKGIDGDLILEKNYFSAREARASFVYFKSIRDKHYPYEPNKIVMMPQDQIMGIETPFYLKKVIIENGKIDYIEIPSNSVGSGKLWIDKIKLNAENLTNDRSLLAKNDTMHITMEGYLYSVGLIQIFANMPLTDPQKRHYVYGKIGSFDPSVINHITVNCAQIKISKCNIESGEFEFFADSKESIGTMDLRFQKLRMKILTKDGNRLKGDNLKSLVASLFITHNNPEPGKDPIIGEIHWNRDKSRWITNYWWKSLFSGINGIVMSRSAQLKTLERNFQQLKKRPDFK